MLTKYMASQQLESDMMLGGMLPLDGRRADGLRVEADLQRLSKDSVRLGLAAVVSEFLGPWRSA